MRVVLDTNVLLSAAFFPGVCEKMLAHCFLTPSIQLVLSEHILGEFVEHGLGEFVEHGLGEFVEHGLGKLNGTADQIDAAVAELRRRSQIVAPAPVPADTISDPDDLPVLGAAIAGKVADIGSEILCPSALCSRCGSTGTARRFETSQECSRRTTSSGGQSRRSPSATSASNARP